MSLQQFVLDHAIQPTQVNLASENRRLTALRKKAFATASALPKCSHYANCIDIQVSGHKDLIHPPDLLMGKTAGLVTMHDHLANSLSTTVRCDFDQSVQMHLLLFSRAGRLFMLQCYIKTQLTYKHVITYII